MKNPLSLLVVDISVSLEEALKAQERGYPIGFDNLAPGGSYVRRSSYDVGLVMGLISYPSGSVRAGLNAIIDTTRVACESGVQTYAAEYDSGIVDGDIRTCYSLQPYIPKTNLYRKQTFSAFNNSAFVDRISADDCKHLTIIGYDRDYCVLETIQGAVQRGITVVTSEQCMLTQDRPFRRNKSLNYFRKHTIILETLEDVWNYIRHSSR